MDDSKLASSLQHAQRLGFALKRLAFQCIRHGDTQGMASMFGPWENIATISGALSDDLDHARISCIFTWAQAALVAESGGLTEEESSELFYEFARKAYETDDVDELLLYGRQMLMAFAEAVERKCAEEGRLSAVTAGMRHIDEQLYNGVTAQRVAEHLHFSPDYLSRLFREATGETLSSYIRSRKIEDAKALLESSPLDEREIGSRLGFGTHSHFSSVFKKLVGMTPREYRMRTRQ